MIIEWEELRADGTKVPLYAVSPDGLQLVTASNDNTVRLWNLATAAHVRTFAGHTSHVTSVAWKHDGTQLVTGSADRTVRIWNVADGSQVLAFSDHGSPVTAVAFHPDGTTVASAGSDKTIRLWTTTPPPAPAPKDASGDGAKPSPFLRTIPGHGNVVTGLTTTPLRRYTVFIRAATVYVTS